ncbi:MAG: hypothetical protein H6581_14790 [Bacteroidia bacterium]|nr:hypothetical protein [Bacteroidia bacterium]
MEKTGYSSISFLYYQTPERYIGLDNVPTDPKLDEIFTQLDSFEEYLQQCSPEDVVKLLILIFRDQYPNLMYVDSGLVEKDVENGKLVFLGFKRDDLEKANFVYFPGYVDSDKSGIDYFELSFKAPTVIKPEWITEAMGNVPFEIVNSGSEFLLDVKSGPISQISLKANVLTVKINPEDYIWYY